MKFALILVAALLFCGIVAAIIIALASSSKKTVKAGEGSYFDGGILQLIAWRILAALVTTLTFGIAFPWAVCMLQRWETKHTVINGRRLKFTGKGIQLLGKYILWSFLTVITLGIYGTWLGLGVKKWVVKHTVYDDDTSGFESRFTGGAGGWFVNSLLVVLASVFTLGILTPWATVHFMKWEAENSVINGSPLVFEGTGGQLFVKNLLLGILTPVTLGIYALFYPVKILRWQYSNTQALYKTDKIIKRAHSHEESANVDFAKFKMAGNEVELNILRSGINGNESVEQLKTLSESGNPYAAYRYAKATDNNIELIKTAANCNYHPALFDYALSLKDADENAYVNYLELSAKNGNISAPWALRNYYAEKAFGNKENPIENLKKSLYWFKIAIEQGNPDALEQKRIYGLNIDTLALMYASKHTGKKVGSGPVIGLVAGLSVFIVGALLVLAVLFGITPRMATKEPMQNNVTYAENIDGTVEHNLYFENTTSFEENSQTLNVAVYDTVYAPVQEYINNNYYVRDDGNYDALKYREITVNNSFANSGAKYEIDFHISGMDRENEVIVYDPITEKITVVNDLKYQGIINSGINTQKLHIFVIIKGILFNDFNSWYVDFSYKFIEKVDGNQEVVLPENSENNQPIVASELTIEKAKELVDMKNVGFLLYHFENVGMADTSRTYELYTMNNYYVTCYAAKGIDTIDDLKNYLYKYYTKAYADKHFIEDEAGHWRIENNVVYFEPNYAMGSNAMDRDTAVINKIGEGQYAITAETEWSGPETFYVSYEDGDYKIDLFIGPEFTKADAWNLVYNLYEMENRTVNYFESKGMLDKSKTFNRTVPFGGDGKINLTAYAFKDFDNAEKLRQYVYNFCTPDYHLAKHSNPSVDVNTATSYMAMWFTEGGTIYASEQYDYPWIIKEDTVNVEKTESGYFVTVNQFAAGNANGNPEMELQYTVVYENGKYLVNMWGSHYFN